MIACGKCQECCKGPQQRQITADEAKLYKRYRVFNNEGMKYMLARKENEDCYYLNADGCSIYETRPDVCRAFDCRDNWREHQPRIALQALLRMQTQD